MEQAAAVYWELLEGNEKPVAGSTCEFWLNLWFYQTSGYIEAVCMLSNELRHLTDLSSVYLYLFCAFPCILV